ncbi:InlB B-repeat-containing protein [Lysinibacillus piscis]|uniref:SLH domain-containing protein n=1 Tax=Lysinibacillus piscis TaxID=2518931 RepID=A0ABQ5NNV6_9BACI|nr:InlB B-repeat-containing protein [Lysinibacillus sp. KH24]GLC90057.1 hypothetical protein LYSBPC_31840 [Lysinibacillus sp. KH24]
MKGITRVFSLIVVFFLILQLLYTNQVSAHTKIQVENDAIPKFSFINDMPNGVTTTNSTVTVQVNNQLSVNNVIYVKKDATGQHTGGSWEDAFTDLQSALDIVQSGQQIWLAAGTYKPTIKIDPADERTATFQLKNNVALYGGFNGTETDLAQRNWRLNETTLSGDIGIEGDNTDNVYHVLYHPASLQLDATAILDGVTITAGNANGITPHEMGGGMLNDASSPTLINVTFHDNSAMGGGGMINMNSSSSSLTNVSFHDNSAQLGGGIVNFNSSSPSLMNVSFHDNSATDIGGGMLNINSSNPSLMNAVFYTNSADGGSAIANEPTSSFTLINATISDNQSKDRFSQGIKYPIYGGSGVIRNSLIVGNHNEPALFNYTGTIESSLLDVEDNHTILAKFHKTKTNIETTIYNYEDLFTNASTSDYRLKAHSPAINKGDNRHNNTLVDLAGKTRIQGGIIDLGAYEAGFYTVTYNKNEATDGDVPEDHTIYEENNSVTVHANSGNLGKAGYAFTGWNTHADGKGTHYAENTTFQMGTNNITLYAQWTKNLANATILYDANGATGGQVPQDYTIYEENESVTVLNNSSNLIKVGYTFKGWNTQADGKGIAYMPNDTFKMGATNVILYAQWTTNPTYQVQYDANGALPRDNKKYEENEVVKVQGNSGNLMRAGYTFAGWNTQADGKGIAYTENATFPIGKENVTLYAQWIVSSPPTGGNTTPPASNDNNIPPSNDYYFSPVVPVKIAFHTNDGTVIPPIELTSNTKINNLPVPTKEGFRFAGWYQDAAFTKPWVDGALVKESLALYAKWTPLQVDEPITPQEPTAIVKFQDLQQYWAKDMIEELAAQGIIRGYEDGTFRPEESISRMHVALLLTRAFSFDKVRTSDDFSDVSPTHPYYDAIKTLQQAGIIDGSNGAFLPTENMTRAQLAKVLVGVLGLTPESKSSFMDVASDHWSTGYIAVLEHEGIALGDNGYFHPNAPVTRAQFVAFLYRIIHNK